MYYGSKPILKLRLFLCVWGFKGFEGPQILMSFNVRRFLGAVNNFESLAITQASICLLSVATIATQNPCKFRADDRFRTLKISPPQGGCHGRAKRHHIRLQSSVRPQRETAILADKNLPLRVRTEGPYTVEG